MTKRLATVHLPCFSLQVRAHRDPALRGRPLAIDAGGRVAECSQLARKAGVREGQTLAIARAHCPDLVVERVTDTELTDACREIAQALLRFSPEVEWAGGGTFHVGANGLTPLQESERSLLVDLWRAVSELGFTARVGAAGTRFASLLAARATAGFTIVPAGEEAEWLAPLSLALVPLSRETHDRLALMGIRTLGAFAGLPADGLATRFDREVVRWHRRVRGEDPEPLQLLGEEDAPCVTRQLDDPVSGLEPVIYLLESCCEELADALDRRGTAASRLELTFRIDLPQGGSSPPPDESDPAREPPDLDVRRLRPAHPLTEARTLFELCRLDLERRPVAAPILELSLTAVREETAQHVTGEIFGRSLSPRVLGGVVDRLRSLLGEERVVSPSPRESWRREARVAWAPFELERALSAEPFDDGVSEDRTERILPKPAPALVHWPRSTSEAQRRGSLDVIGTPPCGLPAHVDLVELEGPLRVSGEWWEGGVNVDRDEYLAHGADGGSYRACRDRRDGKWSLIGVLD